MWALKNDDICFLNLAPSADLAGAIWRPDLIRRRKNRRSGSMHNVPGVLREHLVHRG